MKSSLVRPCLVALPFLLLNLAGWMWLEHRLSGPEPDAVRIVTALPAGDADFAERLALHLSRPIGGPGGAPAEGLYDFVPALSGRFEWATPDRLEFIPDEPLPPGREWRVEPSRRFAGLAGYPAATDRETLIRTRPPVLQNARIASLDADHVTILFRFSLPVRPAELARRLSARAGGQDLEPEVPTGWTRTELGVRFPRPGPAREIVVRVDGALVCDGGDRPMGAPAEVRLPLASGFTLEHVAFQGFRTSGPRPDQASLELWFSTDLDQRIPPPPVTVVPEVKDLSVRHSEWSRGLSLDGEFEVGTIYTITIPAGFAARNGAKLGADTVSEFRIPPRAPSLHIPFGQGILSPKGSMALTVAVANVPRVRVRATRVHDNNLVPHLTGHEHAATSREVLAREYPLELIPDRLATVALDLRGLLGDARGIYAVEVAADNRWVRDETTVLVTDLGLTAKLGRSGLVVLVSRLSTADSVEGARVAVLSRTNQLLAEGTTGPDGLGRIDLPPNHPDGAPWLVLAEHEGDRSIVRLDEDRRLEDDVEQGGRPTPVNQDVMLYAERGVWRPGETIRLTGIVRRPDGSAAPEFPLSVVAARPDGAQAVRLTAVPGEQGFFHADIETPADGQTGEWRISVRLPGATESLATLTALVEAFVPARIELMAEIAPALVLEGRVAEVSVKARYLFGLDAAGLPLAAAWRLAPEEFRSAAHPEYRFTPPPEEAAPSGALPPNVLDAAGCARFTMPPPESPGRRLLEVTATVTEPGSRSVSRTVTTIVDTARRHVGLRPPPGGVAPAGEEFEVAFVERTAEDGAAPPGTFNWTLSRRDRYYVYFMEDGRFCSSLEESHEVLATGSAPAAAEGTISLRADRTGHYRLEALDPETGLVTRIEFEVAGRSPDAVLAAQGETDRVELGIPDVPVRPGESFPLRVRSPFPGRLLLTVECDEVFTARVVPLEGTEAGIDVALPAGARGSAYVSATVIRPLDREAADWRPHRAAGLARVRVAHDGGRLPLELAVPEAAAPGGSVTVKVAVLPSPEGPPPVVHLFAVDEGVLAVTGFRTPDPFGFFFAPRALSVATADLYSRLLPDLALPAGTQRIGGDSESADRESLRKSSVPVELTRAAVLFFAARPVGPDGTASFDLALPDLRGTLRVMAVAAAGDRYACAEERIVLTTPLFAEVGWPRFLAPGDACRAPVKVFNRTGEPVEFALSAKTTGPVTAAFDGGATLAVPAGGNATAWLSLSGTGAGPAEVLLGLARAGAEPLAVRGAFPVRPAGPLSSVTVLRRIPAGEAAALPAPEGFEPGARRRVRVGSEPLVELRPAIEALLAYPYGCVEQTTSRLTAILAAPSLLADAGRADLARDMIRVGIDRLGSMQTPGGGLAYWPGDSAPCRFGTVYAAEFLTRALREGHEVPAPLTKGITAYLVREIDALGRGAPSADERAQIAHILAAFGRPPEGWMDRLSEKIADLDLGGRAHLAGAFFEAGRRDRALAVLASDTLGVVVSPAFSGRLASQTSGEATLLQVLLDLDPAHAFVAALVDRLARARAGGAWRTTYDNATSIAALARYQTLRGPAEPEPPDFRLEVVCGEFSAAIAPDGAEVTLPSGDAPVSLKCRGRGTAYVSVTTEGLLAGGVTRTGDRGLVVRRVLLDAEGKPADPLKIRVGDLLRVEVTLRAPSTDEPIDNVAVVDALPAGLEVENPRLDLSAARGLSHTATADRVEFLDDRVVLFCSAGPEARKFVYYLRAVTAGRFVLPPVEASCMYEPDLSSIHGGGKAEVR
jgi:uncharacterized protein YfaS (alpha-2-macroglobulin family)